MFPYLDSVARRYPPVIVWAVIGMSVLAFLYQTSLPPRVLDRFLFEFALVPSRFFGQLSLVAPSDWTPFLTKIFLHGGLAASHLEHVDALDLRPRRRRSARTG